MKQGICKVSGSAMESAADLQGSAMESGNRSKQICSRSGNDPAGNLLRFNMESNRNSPKKIQQIQIQILNLILLEEISYNTPRRPFHGSATKDVGAGVGPRAIRTTPKDHPPTTRIQSDKSKEKDQ